MSGSQTGQANGLALPRINRKPTPSAGWTGTIVRVIFGIIFGIDAYLKWLPGYRQTYLSQLKSVSHGQPSWMHGWFRLWITIQSSAPAAFAVLTGVAETALALCLLLGLARRLGYTAGAIYTLLIWAVGEGFGGPYTAGTTDVRTGIVYALLFVTLLAFAPPARRERLAVDRLLVPRWPWWRFLAEPHATDRVRGAPLVEPVVVAENHPHTAGDTRLGQAANAHLDNRPGPQHGQLRTTSPVSRAGESRPLATTAAHREPLETPAIAATHPRPARHRAATGGRHDIRTREPHVGGMRRGAGLDGRVRGQRASAWCRG
jgi:thiosulfate dehydrogenase (quinone) large subunit